MKSIKELYRIGTGPSSSHTMGPRKAAEIFLERHPEAASFKVTLYGSLAATGKGHMTNIAITEVLQPIAPVEIIWEPKIFLPFHPNGMKFVSVDKAGKKTDQWTVFSIGGGALAEENDGASSVNTPDVYSMSSMTEIMQWCERTGKSYWEYVKECEDSDLWDYLQEVWKTMQDAVKRGLEQEGVLPGPLNLRRKASTYYIRASGYKQSLQSRGLVFAYALAVSEETHITATAGIGTNLYLAKIALDIISKHVDGNIGMLTERMYQKYLWHHQSLTDFWHFGVGTVNHLARMGIFDMYGITRCPEEIMYKEFGINAEYIIDHAYGKEPTTITQIKAYAPQTNSISNSQVLFEDYEYYDALLVVKEMVDLLVNRLVSNHLVTDNISLYVGYSRSDKNCPVTGSGGQRKLTVRTSSLKIIMKEFVELYHSKVLKNSKIRQISISLGNVLDEYYESYDLFSNIEQLEEEKNLQRAIIQIKEKYGKNAILKGMNKLEKATTEKRNTLVGGHNAN